MSATEYKLVAEAKELVDLLARKSARARLASGLLEKALAWDDDGEGAPSGDDD